MYLLANLAVGGFWPGDPDDSTPFPATYAIDYIRAYQAISESAVRADSRPRKRPHRPRVRGRAGRRGRIHLGIDIRGASGNRRSRRSRQDASFVNG